MARNAPGNDSYVMSLLPVTLLNSAWSKLGQQRRWIARESRANKKSSRRLFLLPRRAVDVTIRNYGLCFAAGTSPATLIHADLLPTSANLSHLKG